MESKTMHTGAKKTGKQDLNSKKENKELIKRTNIENSPFELIELENDVFVALGQYRLTKPKLTKNECIKKFEKPNWETITQVMLVLLNRHQEITNLSN